MHLELHLTYRCNLACVNCNRACNFAIPHTPDITLDQIKETVNHCPSVSTISFLGGEPTLHPDILNIARYCATLTSDLRIYSNAYSEQSRAILAQLEPLGFRNPPHTVKAGGSVDHTAANPSIFWSPLDFGLNRTTPCDYAVTRLCGYSVDALGVTPCCIGGMIDGILGLGVRQAVGHDPTKALPHLDTLCYQCGSYWPKGWEPYRQPYGSLAYLNGQFVSRRWYNAITQLSPKNP